MISNIFSFKPADTLFFRGAEPMVMGESHSSNFNFPPPAYTIEGAIRTLLYFKDKDKYKDFIRIGKNKGGFNVIGPMFLAGGKVYVPSPYSWYKESKKENKAQCEKNNSKHEKEYAKFTLAAESLDKTKIIKPKKLDQDIDFIKIKSENIYWAKPEDSELMSLGGNWIDFNDLLNDCNEPKIFSTSNFFRKESHVGIALNKNRTVRESHIYAFTHSRLLEDVEILFGLDIDVPLEEKEILTLGAEQRFGLLRRVKNQDFEKLEKRMKDNGNTGYYMSLSIMKGDENANKTVIATGKIQYLGGWDLSKGFHKDMAGYFPAGTVFENKYCKGLILIS